MYHNLNTLTIFPERLEHNFRVLSALQPSIVVVPVVKSNAYGHGIKMLAPLLNKYSTPFVCVDSLYEAYELEKHGYKKDILIMGYVDPRDIPRRRNFIYAVSTLEYAQAVLHSYSKSRLHLFLDTGMHREGIQTIETVYAREVLKRIAPYIEGVMSHLSTPDDTQISHAQISQFHRLLGELKTLGIAPEYRHICASGWLINVDNYGTLVGNLARTGIAFYGYGSEDLLPALRCTTKLIQIKEIQTGDRVGYDGTYLAEKSMKIGVLPIGYHDGMDRRLSGTGFVWVDNTLCPIIGRVSMNLTIVDISDVEGQEGQEIVFISEDKNSPLSLEQQAKRAGMIPYDILVHLNKEMFRTLSWGTK
jgi:alanine racemase